MNDVLAHVPWRDARDFAAGAYFGAGGADAFCCAS